MMPFIDTFQRQSFYGEKEGFISIFDEYFLFKFAYVYLLKYA